MSSQVNKLSPAFVRMAVTSSRGEALPHTLVILPLRVFQKIRGSLRAKFILVIVTLQIAVMGAVAAIMEHHQRKAIFEKPCYEPSPSQRVWRPSVGISAITSSSWNRRMCRTG